MTNPLVKYPAAPTALPSISTIGRPLDPAWVVPAMVTGSEIVGRGVSGRIVLGPGAGMAKVIVSAPGFALASRIAWRNEPVPESLVFRT